MWSFSGILTLSNFSSWKNIEKTICWWRGWAELQLILNLPLSLYFCFKFEKEIVKRLQRDSRFRRIVFFGPSLKQRLERWINVVICFFHWIWSFRQTLSGDSVTIGRDQSVKCGTDVGVSVTRGSSDMSLQEGVVTCHYKETCQCLTGDGWLFTVGGTRTSQKVPDLCEAEQARILLSQAHRERRLNYWKAAHCTISIEVLPVRATLLVRPCQET